MSKGSKIAYGAILGVVSGVIAGVLTAPKSGKETRADIKNKAVELKEQATNKADAVADQAKEVKNKASNAFKDSED